MIEERGRIVALESGAVWVETLRQSACGSCAAQKGCGHSAMARMSDKPMHVRAIIPTDFAVDKSFSLHPDMRTPDFNVGDEIVIGIPEDILLKSSLIAYLMPLMCALVFALGIQTVIPTDAWVALGGATGLALGFAMLKLHARRVSHDLRYHPQVLRYADTVGVSAPSPACQQPSHQA